MKKNLFASFAGILVVLVISITANGQLTPIKVRSSRDISNHAYRNDISVKAVRHFLINFNNVSSEEWYNAPDRFVAMFTLNDINYRADYDKLGDWIETFRTYGENKLPPDVRDIIKSSYYDCGINLVQEIENPVDPVTYIIQLKGKTQIINLRIRDGEMTVLKKYTRSE